MWLRPTFGSKPDAKNLAKIQVSAHYNGEFFVNLEPTSNQFKDIALKDNKAQGDI